MKVLQVSTVGFGDPRYYRSHELTLSKTLVKLGHDVTLFAPNRHPKWQMLDDRTARESVECIDGVIVRRFPTGIELGTIPLMPTLLGELLRSSWDIVHAHTIIAPASFYSALTSEFKKKPLVVTQHDYIYGNVHGAKLFIHKFNNTTFGRFTMHRARAVIGLSSNAVRFVQGFGAEKSKTFVVPNSVDTTLFRPSQKSLVREEWGLEGPVVLFVGRLAPDKGVDTLLHAFHNVTKSVPTAKLVIVGRGPQENSLRELQERLGLVGVYFMGRIAREDMPCVYPGCELLVLPSIYEPFGNVVLEAMAAGLPVVGSRIGGMLETIFPGVTGYHITPGNVEELSGFLIQLLMNHDLRAKMSHAARETAVSKFDDLVVARAVEEIYEKCLRT